MSFYSLHNVLYTCHRCDGTHDMDFPCNDLVSTAARHYGGLEHNEFHLLMKLEHGYVLCGLYKAVFNGWFLASRMEHGEEEPQEDGEDEPQEEHGNSAPVFIISADALEAEGAVGGALKADATIGPLEFQAMRYLNLNLNLKRYVELFGPVQSMDHTTKGFLGRDLWTGMFDLLADYQMVQRDFVPTHVGWFLLPRPFSKMQASRRCADDDAGDPSECFYPAYFEVNVSAGYVVYVRMACLHLLWFRGKFWYVHLDRMRSWTKL